MFYAKLAIPFLVHITKTERGQGYAKLPQYVMAYGMEVNALVSLSVYV